MRITSKGQVTIPQSIRESAGFLPHTEVEFELDGTAVRIVQSGRGKKMTRGQRSRAPSPSEAPDHMDHR